LQQKSIVGAKLTSQQNITREPITWIVSIGISRYQYENRMSELNFPVKQAYQFVRCIQRDNLNDEHVVILTDKEAKRENIIDQLRRVFCDSSKVAKNDAIIFYFSGTWGINR
jgi:hypothetical protein